MNDHACLPSIPARMLFRIFLPNRENAIEPMNDNNHNSLARMLFVQRDFDLII